MPSPFAGLARLLFGRRWRKGLTCVLASAWDESEAQDPRDAYAVAACVATAGQWEMFAKAWRKQLPPGAIFHATEWEAGKKKGVGTFGYLKALPAKDVRAKERKLRWTIEEHTIRSFVSAGPGAPHLAKYADVLELHDDPYIDNLFICLGLIHRYKQIGGLPNEVVKCLFERRPDKANKRLDRQYDRITEQWFPGEYGSSTIGRKEEPDMVPLQAADFLSHYTMKEYRDWKNGQKIGSAKHMSFIMARNRKVLRYFQTPKGYDDFMRAVIKEHNENVVTGKTILPPLPPKRIRKRER